MLKLPEDYADTEFTGEDFNEAFDAKFEAATELYLQEEKGCFACKTPNPGKTCSGCCLARYCSVACQKKDWSAKTGGNHKAQCKAFRENRKTAPLGICLASVKYIDDEGSLSMLMRMRSEILLNEVKRLQEASGDKFSGISISLRAEKVLDKIRLVGSVGLRTVKLKVHAVDFAFWEDLDECSPAAMPSGGSGELSKDAKQKVIRYAAAFVASTRRRDIKVRSVSFGHGLRTFRGIEMSARSGPMQDALEEASGLSFILLPTFGQSTSEDTFVTGDGISS